MYLVIGIISVFGVLTGIFRLFKFNKVNGIIQVALSALCPIIAVWFCALKESRAYGGTDLQFIIQSATVDGNVYPWILLILLIIVIILIVETILKLLKLRNTH